MFIEELPGYLNFYKSVSLYFHSQKDVGVLNITKILSPFSLTLHSVRPTPINST